MEAGLVIEVIEKHFDISITNKRRVPNDNQIYLVRCAAVLIMLENTHADKITKLLCGHRTNIYHWKDAANEKLNSCLEFKKCYLECVAAITRKEEALSYADSSITTNSKQATAC